MDAPIATTTNGQIRGAIDAGVCTFKGIPYATGKRFAAPTAPLPWTGVRDATAYAPMCPQPTINLGGLFASWTFDKEMSEDCLAINVWTPALRDGGNRPVMVWFHGGDFSSLSGSRNVFDGVRLCNRGDVVVVTLNHRLNAFGFMYLGEVAPELGAVANPGMLDLVAGLQWVRDNIAEFGGDPGNVTIFGQSGGGGKVATIMAMPAAAGLFHRAIIQSGSYARNAHLQAMTPAEASVLTQSLLTSLDVAPARLADVPMEAMVAGLAKAARGPKRPVWRPVADGAVLPQGPWWPNAPAVSAQIPLMIGTTATETTMLIGTFDPATFDLDEAALRSRLAAIFKPDQIDPVLAGMKAAHPDASASELFFWITTANMFQKGAWIHAGQKAAQNAASVYVYELAWCTPVDGGKWQSPHSVDLPMMFDNVAKSASMVGTGQDAQMVADTMSAAWIAFARSGNPGTPALPWPAWTPDRRATMVFDVNSRVVNGYRDSERKLLEGIPA
jgi:para-nitrobenzyl esterase